MPAAAMADARKTRRAPAREAPRALEGAGIPLATASGRCLWVLSDGTLRDGRRLSHPAVELAEEPLFGECPSGWSMVGGDAPVSVVDPLALGDDRVMGLRSSLMLGGRSWLYFRLWQVDPGSPYGVTDLGTGIGWYDESVRSIRFGDGLLWTPEEEFGDALIVVDGVPLLYGCYGPPVSMTFACRLARLAGDAVDDVRSYEYYLGARGWSAGAADAAIVFHSGPDRSGVVFHGRRGEYLHIYAEGFGTRLVVQRAVLPEGPWSAPALLIACEVPAGDANAFCREPAVHPELMDPLRPDELAITYDLDTPDAARRAERPLDYWPRLVRVAIP